MTDRLAAADAALNAGRSDEAIGLLEAALAVQPDLPCGPYLTLARQLYLARRYAEALQWTVRALERHPRAYELWNLQGVCLRELGRPAEALVALETAIPLAPADPRARLNRGNVLVDLGQSDRAAEAFSELVRDDPENPTARQLLASVLATLGQAEEAGRQLRELVKLRPDLADAWLSLAALATEKQDTDETLGLLDRGLAASPTDPKLAEAKALVLRTAGRLTAAEAYLRDFLDRQPQAAWACFHLGDLLAETDRAQGEAYLRQAVALDPNNLGLLALIQSLERTTGPREGESLDEAMVLAQRALVLGAGKPGQTKVLMDVFVRLCAFDDIRRLGGFAEVGRSWAAAGMHTALLNQLALVESHEDRLELLEQHRIWGRRAERVAARSPIRHPAPRSADGRIRLGFMSSDLRRHVVSYFAQPLFDHVDRERFELYAYSFYRGEEDALQARIAGQVAAFRWCPEISHRDAAQMIADDQLDMLIELGGSTKMNRLEVLAWKPAPRQASWLGYPHSSGLSTVDHFICDPYNAPPDPAQLVEAPLVMPSTWITVGPLLSQQAPILQATPQERNGVLTYGTANHPRKYSRRTLQTWARIVAATPGACFAIIRPEGASQVFRRNIMAAFEAEGVAAERVVFHAVRGDHLARYNEVDISLDAFPLTGGTTTVELLWMGVPVISLKGPAFYERLSWSILANVGLADLCADDVEAYVALALGLAADRERRRGLRAGLRGRILESPLGRPVEFARDFYATIARAVAG